MSLPSSSVIGGGEGGTCFRTGSLEFKSQLSLLLTSCVTLDKSLNPSETLFPQASEGCNEGKKKIIIRYSAKCTVGPQ